MSEKDYLRVASCSSSCADGARKHAIVSAFHLRAVLLPDGTDPVDMFVVDGRVTFEPSPGAEELPGHFVSPGLVDAHVHLSLDFAGIGLPHGSPALVTANLERQRQAGVLALRDAGYAQQLDVDAVELPASPVVLRSGWLTTPPGRFFPVERSGGLTVAKHTTEDELITRVEQVARAGLPWCKIIADFPGADLNLFAAEPNYPIEVIRDAVGRAHELGVQVMVHSTGPFVAELVAAGVDAVEHGVSMTPEVIRAMADQGSCWVPTLASVENFLRLAEEAGSPPDVREAWSSKMSACLALAVQLGVPVLAGSDELPHGQLVGELLCMQRHGMSIGQVLTAATTLGRSVLGLPTLEEGDPADLVLFDRDPREDLNEIGRPTAVVSAGELVIPPQTGARQNSPT